MSHTKQKDDFVLSKLIINKDHKTKKLNRTSYLLCGTFFSKVFNYFESINTRS